MLESLRVVLFAPQYPENIGMAARACANMGVADLVVVRPENFDLEKALPLATGSSEQVLRSARVMDSLAEALADTVAAYGATARTGGWRQGMMSPATCARVAGERMREGGRVALVFGPEKAGLTNAETSICSGLVTIPTSRECSSLNLAQAVLILTYECLKESLAGPAKEAQAEPIPREEKLVTMGEREVLHRTLKETLTAIDYIKADNADYWMLPVRRFLERLSMKRAEFNLLMGICRQVAWAVRGKSAASENITKESRKDTEQ